MDTLDVIQARLASGATTSRALVELALANIEAKGGEGRRTFTRVFADEARAAADEQDRLRAAGRVPSPLAGVPVALKDLFDVQGLTNLAGSRLRLGDPVAARDADAVARLRAAGAVIVGSTNMNEFALGTTGTNRHWGTPANPWDRDTRRLPGGSSSGCAVAVADGMAALALGTDTAGSLRVPAAFCGLVGFKPTASRVSRRGVFPLSHSLDSVGPLARDVRGCAAVDAVLADDAPGELVPPPVASLNLGVLTTLVRDDLDATVAAAYERALATLRQAGATLTELTLPSLGSLPALLEHGGLTLYEALEVHREPLARMADRFDPLVAKRLLAADAIDAVRYTELLAARLHLIADNRQSTAPFDAVLMPTCPVVAPPIASVDDEQAWMALNARLVRWNIIPNMLDRCALSLPCGEPGGAPVGLTLMGEHGADRALLGIGAAVEAVLAAAR